MTNIQKIQDFMQRYCDEVKRRSGLDGYFAIYIHYEFFTVVYHDADYGEDVTYDFKPSDTINDVVEYFRQRTGGKF